MTVHRKVKYHVPGITFLPYYPIFNLLPAVKDVSASVFALKFTFPLPIRPVNLYRKIVLTAGK
jgi:hypothetical protein